MPKGGNKRQALSQTPSPTHPPTAHLVSMDSSNIHAKLDLLIQNMSGIQMTVNSLDATVKTLVQDNAALRSELASKDEKIQALSDQVNRLDQASRATSLRILGLDVSTQSSPATIHNTVYKEILLPTLEAAKAAGDMVDLTSLPSHFLITNAFAIPPGRNSRSSTVIVKLQSEAVRSMIFKHKKLALPTTTDISTNRVRNKYSIFEDLSPASHAQLRAFNDDIRVKSVWTFGGQIRFKTNESEQVYKTKSLSDTYDTIIKPGG
jgi:hypothetical protein